MLELETRERAFWDARAKERPQGVRYFGDIVNTDDPKLVRLHLYALSLLGDIRDKKVLDIGCGYGALSCHMAKRGARVTAVDISEESLAVSRDWFEQSGVKDRVETRLVSAHELPFQDASFDFIVGSCILHHLDPARSGPELARALKPGGKAVFVENNADNRLLLFFRDRVLSPLKLRRGTDDEFPLDETRLEILRRSFPSIQRHFPEMVFFRLAASFFLNDFGPARRALAALDGALLRAAPGAGAWSYFQVVELAK